jgi:hypothetical protein
MKVKIFLLIKENKIICLLILFITIFSSINIFQSYSMFISSTSTNVVKGVIGDISNGDLKIKIYTENRNDSGVGDGTYAERNAIPLGGYSFNSTKSSCKSNSTFSYDETNHKINITSLNKDVCEFYFDAVGTIDFNIKIYIQNRDADGKSISNSYVLSDHIPKGGYTLNYTKSSCNNNSTYSYNSTTSLLNINSTVKDICNFYFDSISNSDVIINIYKKTSNCSTSCSYKLVDEIPHGKTFNSGKSNCTTGNISYDGTNLLVTSTTKTKCNAYFD